MKNLYNALRLKQFYILKELGYEYIDFTPYKPSDNRLQLPDNLDELKKIVSNCHLCELSKSRTKTVFGEGNPNAELMFIGEGPGATEDSTGRPFVGRAGELLTRMIEGALLIPRSSVYIANIVKCRPPNNRDPNPVEAMACRDYLTKQIEIIKPAVIVTLGKVAYRYLTSDESPIGRVRGEIIKSEDGYIIVPTYHPSYLLRNPSAKKDAYKDMLLVKSLLNYDKGR